MTRVHSSQERRGAPRAAYRGWVAITVEGRRRLGSGRDLGPGGAGLALGSPPPPDTRVTSEFTLPGISLPLALEGAVAWSDPESGRLGVRFERVDPGLRELLERYVAGQL